VPLERRHARIPAAIALVALAAFAVLWVGARTPFARGMVAGRITDATGLTAAIQSLGIGFFPSPTVDIGGLTIAQPPGFGDEPFATVGRLRVRIPWSGIFSVSELRELSAEDAIVRLVVDRQGIANWSKLGAEPAGDAPSPDAQAADWALGSLRLERGAVDYRDLASGSQWQLAAISLDADGIEPARAFPFDLKLGGVFGTNTTHFALKGEGRVDMTAGVYEGRSLAFRGWLGGEPLPLAGAELEGELARASYASKSGVAVAEAGRFKFAEVSGKFEGRADLGAPATEASVAVTTEPFEPRPTAIILGRPLPATADPAAFASLQLALTAQLQDGTLRLDPVSGRLDDTTFEASLVPAQHHVRASLDRIDLNRYLPKATAPATASGPKATLESVVSQLGELDVDAEIRVEEARVAGGVLRDAVIRVERTGPTP
jgi:AsmA protein